EYLKIKERMILGKLPRFDIRDSNCNEEKGVIKCGNKFNINLKTGKVSYGRYVPSSLIIVDENVTRHELEGNIPYALILYTKGPVIKSVLVKDKYADSLFIKMLLLKGEGLKHFKLLAEDGVITHRIAAYKAVW
ncbi:hypothetical protein D6745_00320, partial [Candidatus Woesearchaeota archaeon]